MGYVTKEQIKKAKQVDILDYMLTHEPNNLRRVGSGYRLKDHESLAITQGKWFWHSQGYGGRDSISFLTNVRGYSFVDAVCLLANENAMESSATFNKNARKGFETASTISSIEKTPFKLPLRNQDNKRAIAYLLSRGIDNDLINHCIKNGSIYESRPFHNVVFIGKDKDGKTRYAAMRSTTSNFKRDADGSDKRCGFVIPPKNLRTNQIAIFEAPIDSLSHQTLCKNCTIPPFEGWRLSMGGTSILALEYFLENNPQVTHCLICTDNDEAGNLAAERIGKLSTITSERSPPNIGNDWNDMLQSLQKVERNKNKTQQPNQACL